MELSLEKQLTIVKIAKNHYVSMINSSKKIAKHNKTMFLEFGYIYRGLCYVFKEAIYLHTRKYIYYNDIIKYIPIFKAEEINKLSKLYNYKLKKADTRGCYWYEINEYQVRINVLNLMIKHLQIKIKENGKELCNVGR